MDMESCQEEENICRQSMATIHGLQSLVGKPHNGKTCRVLRVDPQDPGRSIVSIPGVESFSIKQDNLDVFPVQIRPSIHGLGLFATRDIKRGEVVIKEKPLLAGAGMDMDRFSSIVNRGAPKSNDDNAFAAEHMKCLVDENCSIVTEEDRAAIRSLAYDGLTPKGFARNMIPCGLDTQKHAVYSFICRINHHCTNHNVVWEWAHWESPQVEICFASQDISKDSELLSCYNEFHGPKNFMCSCSRDILRMRSKWTEMDSKIGKLQSSPVDEVMSVLSDALHIAAVLRENEWRSALDVFQTLSVAKPLCEPSAIRDAAKRCCDIFRKEYGDYYKHHPRRKLYDVIQEDPMVLQALCIKNQLHKWRAIAAGGEP